jgi:hypothetical protein
MQTRFCNGFCRGHTLAANFVSTITSAIEAAVSASENPRPDSSGVFMVSKYPGVANIWSASIYPYGTTGVCWSTGSYEFSSRFAALVAAEEHPVIASHRHAADVALGGIIVDAQKSRCSAVQFFRV